MTTIVLIHGGLWENMDAEAFWHRPGIVAGLRAHGAQVLTPDRARRAPDWTAEADHLSAALPVHPVTVVAGSYGCSAAVRLAHTRPDQVERLLLAWPATAGDPEVDARARDGLAALGATPPVIDTLLTGPTLPGITDDELDGLTMPVGVLPSVPENPVHQRRTVDALLGAVPRAAELPGCPEPPRPTFPPHADTFTYTVATFAALR